MPRFAGTFTGKIMMILLIAGMAVSLTACPKKPQSDTASDSVKAGDKVPIWHFKTWLRKRKVRPERSAAYTYNDAMHYFTRKGKRLPLTKKGIYFSQPDYTKARELFEEVLYHHPLSKYAPLARLHIADSYYEQGKYDEAIASYQEFRKIHITREEIPFVTYRIGMSYFHQMFTHDRDQTNTKHSLREFTTLRNQYPTSPYAMAVEDKIVILRGRLAKHEMYVGKFYFRHGEYWSAVDRYIGVLANFKDMPVEEEARFYLGRSYLMIGRTEMAKAQFEGLEKKYPDGKFSKRYRFYLKMAEEHPIMLKFTRQRGYYFP